LGRATDGEPERPGGRFFPPLRHGVEPILDILNDHAIWKNAVDIRMQSHQGVLQRLLAMTTENRHNDPNRQPVLTIPARPRPHLLGTRSWAYVPERVASERPN
jgi:hypothetical protein